MCSVRMGAYNQNGHPDIIFRGLHVSDVHLKLRLERSFAKKITLMLSPGLSQLGHSDSKFLTERLWSGCVWKTGIYQAWRVYLKTLSSCIMGSMGSSVCGAWLILVTKNQDTSALFWNVSHPGKVEWLTLPASQPIGMYMSMVAIFKHFDLMKIQLE